MKGRRKAEAAEKQRGQQLAWFVWWLLSITIEEFFLSKLEEDLHLVCRKRPPYIHSYTLLLCSHAHDYISPYNFDSKRS